MKEKVTQVVYGHLEGPLQEYIVDVSQLLNNCMYGSLVLQFFFKEYKKRVKDRHSAIYKTYNEKVTETKRNVSCNYSDSRGEHTYMRINGVCSSI